MPTCHKCPHRAAVEAGKYADTPFERVPCFACRFTGDIPNHKGRSILSLDAEGGAVNEIAQGELADRDTPLPELPTGLLDFFTTWLELPSLARDSFAWRVLHPTVGMDALAKERGISTQAVQQALKRAEPPLCTHLGARFIVPHMTTYGTSRATQAGLFTNCSQIAPLF